ncbi:MAG: potassium/proton antiporter [Holophagales bacterium]|jgi:cell volume regulation protein A|nr:potassium/proton antiporter [Holophagales bacterium]
MDVVLLSGVILIISALSCKTTDRLGVSVLVGFIAIGVLIGKWFRFESTMTVDNICRFALLLIIFNGGFQTDFSKAKPVLKVSSWLSSAGTLLTAGLCGAFAYYVMRFEFYQAMLLGAVISSTDAASVFSILHSKNCHLKNNLGPILEIESGSNDPFAYMLTVLFLTLATGGHQNIFMLLTQQIVVQIVLGVASGVIIAKLGQLLLNKFNLSIDGLYSVLLCGTAFLIYGAAEQFNGNGFLAVYIGGIILGNSRLVYKGFLSRLFNSFSMIMQILLFIVLGILCVPSDLKAVAGSGLLFAVFLTLVARPAVIYALMRPFRRTGKEIALVSWAGFRGASSIVFATIVLYAGLPYSNHVFSIAFFVCLLSAIVQGWLMVPFARMLGLTDE